MKLLSSIQKVLITKGPISPILSHFLIILDKIHLLGIALVFLTEFLHSTSDVYSKVILEISKGIIFVFDTNSSINYSIFIGMEIYSWCVFILTILSHQNFISNKPLKKTLCELLGIVSYFHKTVGIFWLFTNHVQIIHEYMYNGNSIANKSSAESVAIFIVSILSLVWNIILGLLLIKLSPSGIKHKSGLSVKVSIILFLSYIEKMILLIAYLIFHYSGSQSYNQVIVIFTSFGISVIRSFLSLSRFPFWKIESNKLEIKTNFLLTALNLIILLGALIEEKRNNGAIIYLVTWIFLVPTILKICSNKFDSVLKEIFSESDKLSPWQLISRHAVIVYMMSKKVSKREDYDTINTYKLWVSGLFEGRDKYSDPEVIESSILRSYELLSQKYQNFIGFRIMKLSLMIKFRLSPLKIFDCLEKCLKETHSLATRTSLDILKEKLERNIREYSKIAEVNSKINLIEFISMQDLYQNLKSSINNQISLQKSFWQEIIDRDTDFKNLFISSRSITEKRREIDSIWNKYQIFGVKNFDSPKILYAIYLTTVNNQPLQGNRILKKISMVNANKALDADSKQALNNVSVYEKDTIRFIVNVSSNNLGKIVDVSSNLNLIGFSKKELIGYNIQKLMPEFFANRHDNKLARFYETGISRIANNISNIFVKDEAGFYHESDMMVTLFPSVREEITMIGLIKLKNQNQFLLITQDGRIQGCSNHMRKIFRTDNIECKSVSNDLQNYIEKVTLQTHEVRNRSKIAQESGLKNREITKNCIYHDSESQISLITLQNKYTIRCTVRTVSYLEDEDFLHIVYLTNITHSNNREMFGSKKNLYETKDTLEDSVDYLFRTTGAEKAEDISTMLPQFGITQAKTESKTLEQPDLDMKEFVSEKKEKTVRENFDFIKNIDTISSLNYDVKIEVHSLEAQKEVKMVNYQASTSISSTTSKIGTDLVLEKSISFVLKKPRYIFFRWISIAMIFAIIAIISSETVTFIYDQDSMLDYKQVVVYSYQRADYIVQVHYILMQMKMALDGIHESQNLDYYISYYKKLTDAVMPLQYYNKELLISLGLLDDNYQDEFFENAKFFQFENEQMTNQSKSASAFQLVEETVEKSLAIINLGANMVNTTNVRNTFKYLEYNIINGVLLACEHAINLIEEYIRIKFDDTRNYIMALTGVGIAIIAMLIFTSFGIIKYVCDDMNHFASSLSNINELDCIAAKNYLDTVMKCILNDNYEDLNGDVLKQKIMSHKKSERRSRAFTKQIKMRNSCLDNALLVGKIWPMTLINFVIIILINSTTQQSIDSIQDSQIQIQSSLQLIYLSDLAFVSLIGSLVDKNIPVRTQSIYSQAEYYSDITTRTDVWVSKFSTDKTKGTVIEKILYGMGCQDPLLKLASSDQLFCEQLSGGDKDIGLLDIMAFLAQQKQKLLSFRNSVQNANLSLKEALTYVYDYFEPTNFIENYYLMLLNDVANSNLRDEINDKSNLLMLILIPSIIATVILLLIVDRFVLIRIIEQGNQVKGMISIVPLVIIVKNKSLKEYLSKNSGKIGDSVKKLSEI